MHGVIFSELKKYVDAKFGDDAWLNLIQESGVEPKIYMSIQEYPDEEMVALVSAASRITSKSVSDILLDFGEFAILDLMGIYAMLINPAWKTLDLIENTEETIHTVIRFGNLWAKPPELKCSRISDNEIVVTYNSPRKMCAVAKGIATGIAGHYNEQISITETSCMLQGDPSCEISIKIQ